MDYKALGIREEIGRAIEKMGFGELAEVQEKAIPPMLAGRDVVGKAPTGTGKTAPSASPSSSRLTPRWKSRRR